LSVLRRSLQAARLGNQEKVDGLHRLDWLTRAVEQRLEPTADWGQLITHERAISKSLYGHLVGAGGRRGRNQLLFDFTKGHGREA
jgi:uncharacterized protein